MNRSSPSARGSFLSRAIAMPYLVGWIIGFVFVVVGGIVTAVAGGPSVRYVASYSWPKVPGTVHSVEMTTAPTRRRSVQAWVRPVVEFQYNDQRVLGKADDLFGMGDLDLARVAGRVEELRRNPYVQVLVDPSDPSRSVLQRGTFGTFLLHSLVFLFPLIGLGSLAFTGLSFAYEESGRPRRGFLGWWGGLGREMLKSDRLQVWVIRILVLIPMLMILVGIAYQNWILAGLGGFIGWSVWQASRPARGRRR